jgi:ribulose-phosphate 3-epimerase
MKNTLVRSFQILPSVLAADSGKLIEEAQTVDIPEIEYLHIDVMDGHFVPNLTMGPAVVKSLKKHTRFKLDVHLMVSNPAEMIPLFAEAGADILTIHQEANVNIHRQLDSIKKLNIKSGISLNPATPLESITWILSEVNLVLLMSVNPGFGGQKFIPLTLEKVKKLRELRQSKQGTFVIEVDGGIDVKNVGTLFSAGTDYFVIGTGIFRLSDRPAAIREIIHFINHD